MTDVERTLLDHYNLSSLYPNEWPAEKDDIDDEEIPRPSASLHRVSRLSALGRGPSIRSNRSIPGSQKDKDGLETLVQKDEADPLGESASVVQKLRQRGLPVQEDVVLRNRFLLSSTTFSPTLFLSEVHNDDSTEDLMRGLEHLSRSIEKKSASLKVLVESNFERFVRAKATIDNVYIEMRNHGAEVEHPVQPNGRKVNRSSNSVRQNNGPLSVHGGVKPLFSEKRKNALIKESEYGVQGIKGPLIDATVKAEEIWGPALGGREREESLKSILTSVEKYRAVFEIGASIEDCIKRRDYKALGNEYAKAQRWANQARMIADRVKQNQERLTDPEIHQIVITGRIWIDVEDRVEGFKRETWGRLTATHFGKQSGTQNRNPDDYLELIAVLLRLGVQDNPIWVWLLSRYAYLRNKIATTFERFRVEIEISRRRLANTSPRVNQLATYLRAVPKTRRKQESVDTDSRQVIEFWEKVCAALNDVLAMEGGVLGEVLEFWETTQSFIDGKKQRKLPGLDEPLRTQHQLSSENVRALRNGIIDLLRLIQEQTYGLFVDPPVDDISSLFNPVSPTSDTPNSAARSPLNNPRFNFDPKDIPARPKAGEPWDKLAFWAPHSNSVSAATFLSKINTMIGVAAAEIAAVDVVKQEGRLIPRLRNLVGEVRERSITAICATWLSDSEHCQELEDWTRSLEQPDITTMPAHFTAFENSLLIDLRKIMYIPDATNSPGSADVVSPSSPRHIEMVQNGFKNSLYKAFSGMMEHAAKPVVSTNEDDLTKPILREAIQSLKNVTIDVSDINARKLLTMSNFVALRNDVIPALISQFESNFSVTITEDAKTVRDVLNQMSIRVFQAYVRPITQKAKAIIAAGIASPNYAPSDTRPTDAQPYVYEVLLLLVLTHTEVSRTAPSMTSSVLSYLLEQLSQALIEAFKLRPRYTLSALMQATLDVEFIAQTLNNYTTERAGEIQGSIYLALDERTDNEARLKLQSELPEMRAILKRLRDGTRGEFVCFKKVRGPAAAARQSGQGQRPSS